VNPWFETIIVGITAFAGVFFGGIFSRSRKPCWLISYIISVLLIAILLTAQYANLHFPFLSWIAMSRAKFVVLCLATTLGLTALLARLPNRFEKLAVCILMIVVVVWFSIFPFLVPALIQNNLANLKTRYSSDGICLQTTKFTCGPAAAVTALKKLGLSADEGQIAILARSSPVAGTQPWYLYKALQNRYGANGLECRYRYFKSAVELREAGVTLAVVKESLLLDHCVTVLEVLDRAVVIGDPVLGKKTLSFEQFGKIWRFSGITLKRSCAFTNAL